MENREETLDTNLLPPDVRPRFKALSKDELAVQALILDLRHCQPDQDLIRNLHTQARQRIVSLRDRTKVRGKHCSVHAVSFLLFVSFRPPPPLMILRKQLLV